MRRSNRITHDDRPAVGRIIRDYVTKHLADMGPKMTFIDEDLSYELRPAAHSLDAPFRECLQIVQFVSVREHSTPGTANVGSDVLAVGA